MSSVLSAALLGAIGGGFGAAALWLVGRVFPKRPKWLGGLPIITAFGLVALARAFEPSVGEQLMAEVDAMPVVQAIRAHYPADYAKLQARVEAISSSSSASEAHGAVFSVVSEVGARQLPKANDENALAMFALSRDQARALGGKDPVACVAFLNGQGVINILDLMPEELQARDQQVTSAIFIQAATQPASPAKPLDSLDIQPIWAKALAATPEADRATAQQLLQTGRAPQGPAENRAMCAFNAAMFDTVLAMPKATGGPLARRLLAP